MDVSIICLGWDVAVLSTQIDSIHQQQKALGRARTFDQLAAEQRTASAGRDMEQLLVKLKEKEQHLEAFEEKITTQGSRYNFSNNCHILRYENIYSILTKLTLFPQIPQG